MAGLIKGGAFVYSGSKLIHEEIIKAAPVSHKLHSNGKMQVYSGENFGGDVDFEDENFLTDEQQLQLSERLSELDEMREKYINDGEKILEEAKENARRYSKEMFEKATEEATASAHEILEKANQNALQISEQASKDGFAQGEKLGFDSGYQTGFDEGMKKALLKCSEQMKELKALCEEFESEKEKFLRSYEKEMFDTIFIIANKVTLDSLKQKEKAVIQKAVKSALKEFRITKNVKVTLSGLDVSEEVAVSQDMLREFFEVSENVVFEIIDEAPAGTIVAESGGEVVDASFSTQLKMIEELGRGKYRDKLPKKKADDAENTAESEQK